MGMTDQTEPVPIGEMSKEAALEKLEPLGGDVVAAYLGDPPWKHTSHEYGFIPASSSTGTGPATIQHVGTITPDPTLKNKRLNIALNRLRVADYPGDGNHLVLFEFSAQNQITTGAEQVNFNVKVRATEGGQAAIIGLPIFVGLSVGSIGLSIRCQTVNVANEDDEKLLAFLDSETFKSGLTLVTTAQPAIAPLSQMVVGLTKSVAARRRNLVVQEFRMGLDFGGTIGGARLAEGDYVVVQMPEEAQRVWDWSAWHFDRAQGQIVSVSDASMRIPYNYLIFGITEYSG